MKPAKPERPQRRPKPAGGEQDVRGPQDSVPNSLTDPQDWIEKKFDYDDVVQQSFPASDPPPGP